MSAERIDISPDFAALIERGDLPSIGYLSGSLNNASFTRAFARRYGVTPSNYRAIRLAA